MNRLPRRRHPCLPCHGQPGVTGLQWRGGKIDAFVTTLNSAKIRPPTPRGKGARCPLRGGVLDRCRQQLLAPVRQRLGLVFFAMATFVTAAGLAVLASTGALRQTPEPVAGAAVATPTGPSLADAQPPSDLRPRHPRRRRRHLPNRGRRPLRRSRTRTSTSSPWGDAARQRRRLITTTRRQTSSPTSAASSSHRSTAGSMRCPASTSGIPGPISGGTAAACPCPWSA